MSSQIIFHSPFTKKLMLESQCSNGKCYVRLISMLPNYKLCSIKSLEHAIVNMTARLGSKPEGMHVLPELYIANEILGGNLDLPITIGLNERTHNINLLSTSGFLGVLFDSSVRFAWEEIDGVQHIGGFIDPGVSSVEVYNSNGYSARFVLCMLVNPGVRIGANDTFSDLFEQIQFADELVNDNLEPPFGSNNPSLRVNTDFHDSGLSDENEELKAKMDDRLKEIEVLNSQVRALQGRIKETASHRRSSTVDEITMRRFSDLFEKQTRLKARSPKTELSPDDSSSHVSRYENKYLDQGTVLNVEGDGRTVLQTTRAYNALRPEKEVVVGYLKTDDMIVRESKIYKKVNTINGLANPFHSHRLNFLCHFDTAIRSIQIRKEDYTLYDTILWISKHKSMSPSQELLYQVVINTFDLDKECVVANPYKLPFLEVGMLLSDDCLAKCFNLIRLEFKTLWFEKMKGLSVPEFHDEFSSFKEHKLSTNKDKEGKVKEMKDQKEVRFVSKNSQQRKKQGSSILSFIKE